MVFKYLHMFTFFKNHTFMKVVVLPFATISNSLGLRIVCEFEEWKMFTKRLIGKPIVFQILHIKNEHYLVANVPRWFSCNSNFPPIWLNQQCPKYILCFSFKPSKGPAYAFIFSFFSCNILINNTINSQHFVSFLSYLIQSTKFFLVLIPDAIQ